MNKWTVLFFTDQTACNEDTMISLQESEDLPKDERDQHQGHAGFCKQACVAMQMDSYFSGLLLQFLEVFFPYQFHHVQKDSVSLLEFLCK